MCWTDVAILGGKCLRLYVVVRYTVYTATHAREYWTECHIQRLISKFSFLYEARSLGRIVIAREDACATRHRRSVLFHRETAVHVFRAGCSRHERSLPTIVTPTYQWVGSNRISNAIKSDSSNTTAPMTENRLNWPHENIFNTMHKDSTIEENDRDPNVTHRNGTQNSPWAVDLITPDPT